jgi:hypothetical protein
VENQALTIPKDGGQVSPVADLRNVPLEQLPGDDDVRSMVRRISGSAADLPRIRAMFSSAI